MFELLCFVKVIRTMNTSDLLEERNPSRPAPRLRARSKRGAPRLPAHLLQTPAAADASQSTRYEDTFTEADVTDSLRRSPDVANNPGLASKGQNEWQTSRVTHSPFMRSAIVQGSAPMSRVRAGRRDPSMPVIQSVLGLPREAISPSKSAASKSAGSSPGRLVAPPRPAPHPSPVKQASLPGPLPDRESPDKRSSVPQRMATSLTALQRPASHNGSVYNAGPLTGVRE